MAQRGNINEYSSDTARTELAEIIAQETSGMSGAIPEDEDRALAALFVKIINSDVRDDAGFVRRVEVLLDRTDL